MNEDFLNMFEKMNINIDFETIIKMTAIMEKLNNKKDNPRVALLQSLRPFLKKDTQIKLDQYIEISKILDILPIINSESKGNN